MAVCWSSHDLAAAASRNAVAADSVSLAPATHSPLGMSIFGTAAKPPEVKDVEVSATASRSTKRSLEGREGALAMMVGPDLGAGWRQRGNVGTCHGTNVATVGERRLRSEDKLERRRSDVLLCGAGRGVPAGGRLPSRVYMMISGDVLMIDRATRATAGAARPDQTLTCTPPPQVQNVQADGISALAFAPNADYLAVASWSNEVRIFEVGQGGQSIGKAQYTHEGASYPTGSTWVISEELT